MNIGTDEYDKWLAIQRTNKNIYSGKGSYESWSACFMNRETRTIEQQNIVFLKYIREETYAGNEHILTMIVHHKSAYYKEMETKQVMKRWKAFDEVSDLNDDLKEEIRKFIY